MPTREEIREGIAKYISTYTDEIPTDALTNRILLYLHSQGVVIRVKCPKCNGHAHPNKVTWNLHTGYCVNGHSCPNCDNTGYVATESLMEE